MSQEGGSDLSGAVRETVSELKERVREIERRVRDMETTGMDRINKSIYALENQVSNFRTADTVRKERWSMLLNFVVQLVWVVMAAYVLSKLDIDMGPL